MIIINISIRIILTIFLSFTIAKTLLADGHGNCKHSKWGADDEIGAANYVSEKRTKLASELVKQGKSHPLGIAISSKTFLKITLPSKIINIILFII